MNTLEIMINLLWHVMRQVNVKISRTWLINYLREICLQRLLFLSQKKSINCIYGCSNRDFYKLLNPWHTQQYSSFFLNFFFYFEYVMGFILLKNHFCSI